MIAISRPTYDLDGCVILDELPSSALETFTARVTRDATLDGGVVVCHYGVCDGDRTLTVAASPDEATASSLRRLFSTAELLHVSAADGFYRAALADLAFSGENVSVTLLIADRLA